MQKTSVAVIIANLALFIGLASLPAFQELHHHWIFPILAGLFIAQWLAAGPLRPLGWLEPAAARGTVLGLLGFLLVMGIVRHWTILHCIGRCSAKLGLAAAMAAPVFLAAADRGSPGWGPVRCRTAGLACALWAAWLFAFRLGFKASSRDMVFLALAVVFLAAGRGHPPILLCGAALPAVLVLRATGQEAPVIILGIAAVAAVIILAGRYDSRRSVSITPER